MIGGGSGKQFFTRRTSIRVRDHDEHHRAIAAISTGMADGVLELSEIDPSVAAPIREPLH